MRVKLQLYCTINARTPEEAWYPRGKLAGSFFIFTPTRGRVPLLGMFIPRAWTQLVCDPDHSTGYRAEFRDWLKDPLCVEAVRIRPEDLFWGSVYSESDFETLCDRIVLKTPEEVEYHRRLLVAGWAKLLCYFLNASDGRELDLLGQKYEKATELDYWERYLEEEMKETAWLWKKFQEEGWESARSLKYSRVSVFRNDVKAFEKACFCVVEILRAVCPGLEIPERYAFLRTGLELCESYGKGGHHV